jgi:8-hydroxy-5-deazaflavin:NADPH oxidoreductase
MTISRIGIVGSGPLSGPFARALARAGVRAVIGEDGWSGEALAELAALERNVSLAPLRTAAEEDVVFLSARWPELDETLAVVADWEGRILIDATDPILPGRRPAELGAKTSSEIVRELSPGAQLVKAFNAMPPEAIAAEDHQPGGKQVVFLSGDHLRAKNEISRLVGYLGFAAIDLGGLVSGGKLLQFPDGPLWGKLLTLTL